jgi:hypothetical protein
MVPSVDVAEVEGRLYTECAGADIFPSVDEVEVEGGMLEYWLHKVCDDDGIASSVK